jgi:hypothetical protein
MRAGFDACPKCGESELPRAGYLGGFVPEDLEYAMAAHCLRCRWTGPEPKPFPDVALTSGEQRVSDLIDEAVAGGYLKGGQGRDAEEIADGGNALLGLVLVAPIVASGVLLLAGYRAVGGAVLGAGVVLVFSAWKSRKAPGAR